MKLLVKKGTTSKLVRVFVRDSSSSTGAALTGLVYNSASLVAYYIREGDSSPTAITLATMTVGTWASGGFKEVSSANMPGIYELGIPDAVLASGASSVVIMLKGATNMPPTPIEIQLVSFDPDDAVRMGLTALPNAAFGNISGIAAASDVSTVRAHTDQLTFTNASLVDSAWMQTGSDPTGVPSPTAHYADKVDFLFAYHRNKRTQDSSTETLYKNDNTTVISTKTKSDNGTTLSVGKAT